MACPACRSWTAPDARYCGACGAPLPAAARPALTLPNRRQLTSMFCDIVDSTAIAEALDAEEYRELLLAYRERCTAIIRRRHGELARYLGDGILAHFGFPSAREDDARLAVQAALEICEQIPDFSRAMQARHGITLAVRIGIDTGIVVTDAGEQGQSLYSDGPVGNTLNIASRLQALAPPNGVVIGQDTLRLVQGQFIVKTLGPTLLKGLNREVTAYQVIESSSARSLFAARAATGLSPLVGRSQQLAVLSQEWAAVAQGRGRAVLVTGEPGIGKSRLVHEFQKQVEQHSAVQITCNCTADYQGTAFHPVAVELARVFGAEPADTWPDLVAKVQAGLQRLGLTEPQAAERLALVLAQPADAAAPGLASPASGAEAKQQVMHAVAAYVSTVAARVPLLVIFEDLHWADPSTLELLAHLCTALRSVPVLILASARADAPIPLPVDTRISLERITPAECRTLIEVNAAGKELPPSVIAQLIKRSDGIPLFVEELTKAVEGDAGHRNQDPGGGEAADAAAVPASLQASLMARLDWLGSAKAVAQVAAAIGRAFRLDLLSAVLDATCATLRQEVDRLIEAGLVFPRFRGAAEAGGLAFEFKHELVRNVAYDSLLRTTRRTIHGRIADLLQTRYAEDARRHPEVVAHHFTEAGRVAEAVPLWERAGQRAIRSSNNLEAVVHLSRALALVQTLPATRERTRKELELHLALAAPLMAARGYGAPELDRHLSQAMALSDEAEDAPKMVPLIYGRWSFQQVTGQVTQARELAEQFAVMAERQPEPEPRMIAYRLQGTSLQTTGCPAKAAQVLERSLQLFDPARHTPLAYLYGADIAVMSLCSLGLARWALGRQRSAERDIEEAWERSEALKHRNTLAYCASYRLTFWAVCGRLEGYEAFLRRHARTLKEEKLPVWRATYPSHQGWLQIRSGNPRRAAVLLRECIVGMQAINLVYWQPTVLMWLGEALGQMGRADEADAAFRNGHEIMMRSGERWAEAELLRLWGCMRADAGQGGALELLQASLRVADEQGAATFALRTRLDLVRRPGLAEAQMSMLDDASAALPEPYGGDYEAARQLISFDMRN